MNKPGLTPSTVGQAAELGRLIRERRKSLGVPATVAAESAGMSRVTWHRIERGATTVTLAGWLSALKVLDLTMRIAVAGRDDIPAPADLPGGMLPVRIPLADYPQLKRLAWQLQGVETLAPREALTIYERNWRHLEEDKLEPRELHLIDALRTVLKESSGDV